MATIFPNPEQFHCTVWLITRQIPAGQVSTYAQIAAMMPPPDGVESADYAKLGALWVGQAMNQTPDGQNIPWQRVVNSKGGSSLPGTMASRQMNLLQDEGIELNEKGGIDFDRYGWDGPDAAWCAANGLRPAKSLRKPGSDMTQLKLF